MMQLGLLEGIKAFKLLWQEENKLLNLPITIMRVPWVVDNILEHIYLSLFMIFQN